MAIVAMTGIVDDDYICRKDQDSESPTIWKLRPLNGFKYMEVMTELVRTDEGFKITGKGLGLAVKHGLVGWENFKDQNGKELKFNSINITKIPAVVLGELADRVIEISELGDEQTKNS